MNRRRKGALLLEVMIATVILAAAGVGLIVMLSQTVATIRSGRAAESRVSRAEMMMNRVSSWQTDRIAASVGVTRIGEWDVDVTLARPSVYAIQIKDTLTGAVALSTQVYRPTLPLDVQ